MREYFLGEPRTQPQSRRAAQELLRELMNALLSENAFGIVEAMVPLDRAPSALETDLRDDAEMTWMQVPLAQEGVVLVFAVSASSLHPYQLGSTEVAVMRWEGDALQWERSLNAVALMECFGQIARHNGAEYPSLAQFLDDLRAAETQTALSLEALECYVSERAVPCVDFLTAEQWSAFRDRPFHPTARVKRGWDTTEYQQYGAEFHRPLPLEWMAVRRDHLRRSSAAIPQTPEAALLSADERSQLAAVFDRRAIPPSEYVAIPVHPWQMRAVLLPQFQPEIARRDWVPLDLRLGAYVPSSSVRSLAPVRAGGPHVKLPVGIVALGAVRYLSALSMMNGQKAQSLLEAARQRDPVLGDSLYLCDESHWWAYFPPGTDFFDDRPRHLSCLIRRYPEAPMGDSGPHYIPMSALAVVDPQRRMHVFDSLGGEQGIDADRALAWFRAVCDRFFGVILRLLRAGIVPEIHGQNVVLVLEHERIAGILLRDFDTTRLHLPWLSDAGLDDPAYIVKHHRPNSLYNESPGDLVFYLQTLGIQVNLYAIIDALAQRYRMREERGWQVIRESLRENLRQIEFTAAQRRILDHHFFRHPTWPTKLCVTPLLQHQGAAIGSMPAGEGLVRNPLLGLGDDPS